MTALALLAAANPLVAEQLLHDPLAAAQSHPHYVIHLDDADRVVLAQIRSRSHSVQDFLLQLADALDNINELPLAPTTDRG
ncbi:MAG: hypothetical protein HGA19_02735 [Oscillochloris sp.]|nr:hypothetical protein [Oscillochloris sp.]